MLVITAWDQDWWTRGPSPHLTWVELDCRDGTPYPDEWKQTKAVLLGTEFEHVRARVSEELHEETPIDVSSGFRTVTWNKKVGGARHSRHPVGEAIDMKTPEKMDTPDFWEIVSDVAHSEFSLIRGFGRYDWGAHIDVRGAVYKTDAIIVNAANLTTCRGRRLKAENRRILA